MAKKIIWTKRANRVTQSFVRKTYDIIDLISDQPDLGTLENQERKIRGFLLTKHNRLFYRVTDKEIILLNFFDTRSGPKRRRF
jgi:plasmid stabilization system protein ParE